MEGTLIICVDSILRFRSDYDMAIAVPMLSVQEQLGKNDPFFFLKYFRNKVIIEKGVTISNIFLAIEPWQAMLSAWLEIDIAAYIAEIRKPSQEEPIFDWISIQRITSVHRVYQRKDMKDNEKLSEYFNREHTPTKYFNIESVCMASGYRKGDKEHYSISEYIHEIKNIPVIASDRQILIGYDDNNTDILNDKCFGIYDNRNIKYIQGTTSFAFHELMEAIFNDGLFYNSPQTACHSLEMIKEMLEIIDRGNMNDEKDNKEHINQQESNSGNINGGNDDRELNVEFYDGAFDPLIEHIETEREYWNYIKLLCHSYGHLPVRIGTINEAKVPEYRFYDNIMDDES